VKQYDIVSISLEPTKGNEKGKRRPCLVISQTEFTQVTQFAWVLPITSRPVKYPTDVALKTANGSVTGTIDCAQIRSLDVRSRPYDVLDHIDKTIVRSVKDIVISLLD